MASVLPFPTPMPGADPSVGEIIGYYLSLEARIDTRRARHAWEERERILRAFIAQHGPLRVSQCRKAHLKVWIDANPNLKSDWTRGRWCRTIQRVFNWAANEMELITRNPFAGVAYRRGKRGRPLTDQEFAALLAAASKHFEPVLRFCRLTGARPGEMAAATWSALEVNTTTGGACIVLIEHKTSHLEDATPRVIGLPRELVEMLEQIRRTRAHLPGLSPDHIFLNARGLPWTRNAISLQMARLRRVTGLPADAKLYGLRHAFATGAIERGIALKDVAELMGHSSTRMTEYYTHLTTKRRDRLSGLADRAAQND